METSDEPPYETKGRVIPVTGMSLVMPPTTTKTWTASINEKPVANELAERALGADGDPQPRADHEQVGDQEGGDTDQAELLADRREYEVGGGLGDDPGVPLARPQRPTSPRPPRANQPSMIW